MKNTHCPVSAAEIKRDIDDTALITAQEIQEEEQREGIEGGTDNGGGAVHDG